MHSARWIPVLTLVLAGTPMPAEAQVRPEAMGHEAAVVAGHPLAAAAGAEVLRRGGNAVDAAITMAGVLAVVRPHMNGLGGDAFLLIRDGATSEVHALNGSGRSGQAATHDAFRQRGLERVPGSGIHAANTVPGAVRAWADALDRFGTITLAEALEPAIRYADQGFPVSGKLAADIASGRRTLEADPVLAAIMLPGGRVPEPGEVLRQPELAATLRAIAEGGPDAFYRADFARRLERFMAAEGGFLTAADLAAHRSTWQRPLETEYRDARILAFPPNTQGVALLIQLNLLEHFDLGGMGHNEAEYVHTLVSATRVAFNERDRHVTDPDHMRVQAERLISKDHARTLLAELRERIAGERGPPPPVPGRDGPDNTVYLMAVDAQGNAVSQIQSIFAAWGSGRMVPGTGVLLQNRGASFSLDPEDVNAVAPGKRPYHTLIPAMALRPDGGLLATLGTPGGDGQTQTLTQVIQNLLVFGMSPQQAVEAARYRVYADGALSLEPGFEEAVRDALARHGHGVRVRQPGAEFGGAQIILVDPRTGMLRAGADMRREAQAIAW